MKKTIFATLALGAAITFSGVSSNEASADEIDYNKLAEQAKTNAPEINNEPIQKGNYDFSFSDGEFTYHFYNYNGNFGYEYQYGSTQVNNTSSQLAAQEQTGEQKVDQQQAQFDYQNEIDTNKSTSSNEQPKQVEAPKQETPKQETETKSTGGSVKTQFLNAGGTEAMWNSIVMPESTGNPNATNGQYSGLFQMSPQSGNGTGSVEEQTKSAIKYANERYGSVENAISARQSKGWW